MACTAEVDLASAVPIEAPEVSPPSVPEVMQCGVASDLGDGARESVPEVVGHELLTTLKQELAFDKLRWQRGLVQNSSNQRVDVRSESKNLVKFPPEAVVSDEIADAILPLFDLFRVLRGVQQPPSQKP